MQAKLFWFYLRLRKPIIILSAMLATIVIGLDNWQKYKEQTADYTPWRVTSVDSGSSLTVSRHNESKVINLCGVIATGDEAKKFLTSVVNLGDGTVDLEKVGDGSFEGWVTLKPDYDVELVKHISNKPNELVDEMVHLNTWIIERGFARHDQQKSSSCLGHENLAWAEKIAKDSKLGLWSGSHQKL